MTGKEALRHLRARAKARGLEVRQRQGKGSHLIITVGSVSTTIPMHAGDELGAGLRRAIERDLEPALGAKWMEGKR